MCCNIVVFWVNLVVTIREIWGQAPYDLASIVTRPNLNTKSTPAEWTVKKGGGALAAMQGLLVYIDYLILFTYTKEQESTHLYSLNIGQLEKLSTIHKKCY